ncbi:ABC transporter permease [Mesorhizobium sp. LHD-90]|uniref:ABC transporter permease n=1 Tax=Mesorhizobium sp. LHD-90 TaxID=3071414 RepID=UPI0027E0AD44|nr:ABC transporter permease [Mesorhizobium sp. LHD-90]MDQ6435610.1 ABC transporter permease [Mesorhizobium sp. LHD-90]
MMTARNRYGILAPPLAMFALLVLLTLIGPMAWPHNAYDMDFAAVLAPPSWDHPMGTDANGRDVLARFLDGGRLSLLVGVVVMVGGLVPGALLGILAARLGGVVDAFVMRMSDSIAAFPPILLAMAVAIGLGGGLATAVLGVILSTLPFFARLMRSETRRILAMPFIEAARAMGASPALIVMRHVLPHSASTMLVQSAAVFGYGIATLAGLGFVGLGAPIPTAEWGVMITDGMPYALTGQWWIAVFPGLGILLAVSAANMLADRLSGLLRGDGEEVRP